MSPKKISIIAAVVILILIYHKSQQPVVLGAGVKVANAPIQIDIESAKPFIFDTFEVTPLAEFDIKAKVILREDYSSDRGAKLSPIDLALGWGRMSDESVLEKIEFSQSGRWYRYRYENPPIPQQEIQSHSANMHLIPSTAVVGNQIDRVKAGQVIKIKGKLVSVIESETGFRWKSSLTREDTGGGACELIFVEQFEILEG
ncbi:hypothetical protein [Kangiella sp. HZ709]|uniref:hypothetical protein n=1 Tax=Kangiella sp. HZ709 TaxID=2666328 RepID=UPI0012B01A70|nr:hypothetical protein [Kangiella sp. HZ709]